MHEWAPVEIEFVVVQPSPTELSEGRVGLWDGILHTSHIYGAASSASDDTILPRQRLVREKLQTMFEKMQLTMAGLIWVAPIFDFHWPV